MKTMGNATEDSVTDDDGHWQELDDSISTEEILSRTKKTQALMLLLISIPYKEKYRFTFTNLCVSV